MSLQSIRNALFRDGFITLGDEFDSLQQKVDEAFEKLAASDFNNQNLFKNKYQNAYDLVDEEKREKIRKIIELSNLERYVTDAVGSKMHLSHVQIRFLRVNKASYMPLHRDVHLYNNKLVGPVPIPYKVIFYPKNITQEDCLKVVPRSHRRYFGKRFVDLAVNLMLSGLVSLRFGKTKAVLFETALLHHVPKIKNENSRARLILTFTPRSL